MILETILFTSMTAVSFMPDDAWKCQQDKIGYCSPVVCQVLEEHRAVVKGFDGKHYNKDMDIWTNYAKDNKNLYLPGYIDSKPDLKDYTTYGRIIWSKQLGFCDDGTLRWRDTPEEK